VVTSEARLSGVNLMGAIHIDSIATTVVSRTKDSKPASTTSTVTIAGVTVDGVPATIGSDGLHPGPQSAADPLVTRAQQAIDALRATVDLRTIGAAHSTKGIQTSGDAHGVFLRFQTDQGQLQQIGDVYFLTLELGSAGTVDYADLSSDVAGIGEDL